MALNDVSHHSGAEGQITAAGIVWDINDWNLTETVVMQETSTTRDYVSAENRSYKRSQPTQWHCEGQFVFPFDSKNPALPALRAGGDVAATMKAFNGLTFNFPSIRVGNFALAPSGITGIWHATVPFESNGPYTITVVTG